MTLKRKYRKRTPVEIEISLLKSDIKMRNKLERNLSESDRLKSKMDNEISELDHHIKLLSENIEALPAGPVSEAHRERILALSLRKEALLSGPQPLHKTVYDAKLNLLEYYKNEVEKRKKIIEQMQAATKVIPIKTPDKP